VALVVADTASKWPYAEDLTADFVYVRLHGDEVLYVSGYGDAAIARWAARLTAWSEGVATPDPRCISAVAPDPCAGRDVFCYFDNDAKVMAPRDAQALMRVLSAAGARVAMPSAQ
jgi:uncharacterized protein YecE (DUF72 family)